MTHGILNWKICRECGKPFDIDTSEDLCPECRRNNKKTKKKTLENWC